MPYFAFASYFPGMAVSLCQGSTVKLVVLVADPPPFVTVIGPEVAPVGTVAVTVLVDFTVKAAAVPWKLTLVVPTK